MISFKFFHKSAVSCATFVYKSLLFLILNLFTNTSVCYLKFKSFQHASMMLFGESTFGCFTLTDEESASGVAVGEQLPLCVLST